MPAWLWIALAYAWYLAATAWSMRRFAAVRPGVLAAAVSVTVVAIVVDAGHVALPPPARLWAPLPLLLAGYWLSGLFFVRPMPGVERWLLAMDERVLARSGWSRWGPRHRAVGRGLELGYLLVYVVVPAGAAVVGVAGAPAAIERFWTIVLLAAFACYGVLPWVQTRPPRALAPGEGPPSALRQLNLAILERGSIQANTIPSGHTASAVAVALAVGLTAPVAGALFLVLAAIITAATVAGRYHFVLDAVLGVAVGAAAFGLIALIWSSRS